MPVVRAMLALLFGSGIVTAAWAQGEEPAADTKGAMLTFRTGTRVVATYRRLVPPERRDEKPLLAPQPYKPYLKELFSPAGVNVLRDAVPDHLHHHGLMFAIAVDGVNFWEETPQSGTEESGELKTTALRHGTTGPVGIAAIETVDWLSPQHEKLATEERQICLHAVGPAVSLLTWETRLRPAAGKAEVKLTGSHYFGLGARLPESMDKATAFLFPEGAAPGTVVRGDERLTPAAWCAAVGMVDGKAVTVALFDHPKNARHPATWFTMNEPFAYLSATLNLSKEPLTLKAGETLGLRYGVAVWDGKQVAAAIEKVYQQWREASGEP